MPEPTTTLRYLDYLMLLLQQFGGGPGPLENNLVRFGLAALLWAGLFVLALARLRQGDYQRERLLAWGFGIGFLREFFMFAHVSARIANPGIHQAEAFLALEPLEHTLGLVSVLVVAGSFLGYCLEREKLTRNYVLSGLGSAVLSYAIAAPWWAHQVRLTPDLKFHQSWTAWIFHIASSVLLFAAIRILSVRRSWLSSVVNVALSFYLLGEIITLFNFATDRAYAPFICPIGNILHILAIPLLGYVYLREQSIEKQQAQAELVTYRHHLEELVEERTQALLTTNEQLRQEIHERQEAEEALERLSHHHDLILNSAGEGILGVDAQGQHTFVNRAAALMLGHPPDELIGRPSHTTWHHSYPDGASYPEAECPLHHGYKAGLTRHGDDQTFWHRDGSSFPVNYVSTPIFEQGQLKGAVIVFQDIRERKRSEAEIARLYEETQRWAKELTSLHAASVRLNGSMELPEIYAQVAAEAMALLDCQTALICLWNSREQDAICVFAHGPATYEGAPPPMLPVDQRQSLGHIIHARETVAIEDMRHAPTGVTVWQDTYNARALLILPLWSATHPLGCVLVADTRAPRAWRRDEIALAEGLANLASLVIEKAQLHHQAQRAAVLEERQRIAADVHDGLAQTLSYLGHKVDTLVERAGGNGANGVVDIGDDIRRVIDRTSHDVRSLIASLQSEPEPPRSLQHLLRDAIALLPADPALDIAFETDLSTGISLPADEAEQVMRVVQEALLNVHRHAGASRVTLALASRDGDLAITIEDNGRGFDTQRPAPDLHEHFGLSIMRARAARISGHLDISAAEGAGTRVTLRWPHAARG